MSLIKRKNRSRDFFPGLPTVQSFLDNWGWDDDFSASFWNGRNVPAVNISETEKELVVEVAAPGMEKDDFDVSIDNGRLTISVEKEASTEEEEKDYHRREYSFQSFRRSFWLPDHVSDEQIVAKYSKGVLKITLPKKEEETTKKVKIAIK